MRSEVCNIRYITPVRYAAMRKKKGERRKLGRGCRSLETFRCRGLRERATQITCLFFVPSKNKRVAKAVSGSPARMSTWKTASKASTRDSDFATTTIFSAIFLFSSPCGKFGAVRPYAIPTLRTFLLTKYLQNSRGPLRMNFWYRNPNTLSLTYPVWRVICAPAEWDLA